MILPGLEGHFNGARFLAFAATPLANEKAITKVIIIFFILSSPIGELYHGNKGKLKLSISA
jgi:hypothetical protein